MLKENWTYKKLGEVCKTTSGGTPSKDHKEYYELGTIPWLRSGEVSNRNITETELFITQEGIDNSSAKLVPENSVVVAMYGATVGQVGILKIQSTTNQAVCSILPNNSFLSEFLYYALLANKKSFLKQAVGGAQPNISQQIIRNTIIPIPSITEQAKAVSELDLLQSILDKQQAQLKELDKLAQAVFYDMFGDPVENEKGWAKRPLQAICERITDGSHFSPKEDPEGKIPMLSVKDMGSNGFIYDKCKFINETDYAVLVANGCRPSYNDVLVAKDGSYLKTAFVLKEEIEQAILSSIAILKPKTDTVCPDYLAFFFKIPQTKLVVERHYLTGTAIKRVILKGFKELQLILPPMTLQQSFAAKIESIEKQKAAISQSIAETQKLFDYTMDKYFG